MLRRSKALSRSGQAQLAQRPTKIPHLVATDEITKVPQDEQVVQPLGGSVAYSGGSSMTTFPNFPPLIFRRELLEPSNQSF